ncbi:MAG: DUF542 domain-containing protein [Roseivirga sp.]|nr:DUF542 domain-containing protein [Roseivirga sp.]
MKTLTEKTINSLVDETPSLIEYFEKRGIDYCCGGDISLQKALQLGQFDEHLIIREIEQWLSNSKTNKSDQSSLIDLEYLALSSLIQYIKDKHHVFTREALQKLGVLVEKIAIVHGNDHPELVELNELFKVLKGELSAHLQKEELFVFPSLLYMEEQLKNEAEPASPKRSVSTLWEPIEQEHVAAGQALEQIKKLTNNFSLPEDACSSYIQTYTLLEQLTKDIHVHVHLEEHILMPKAEKLYQQLIN